MSRMHNPPHPGEVIKELCLDPLRLTVTAAAEGLSISRRTLSALLNGHAGISPHGNPIVEGVRAFTGELAAAATAIRSVASLAAIGHHQGETFFHAGPVLSRRKAEQRRGWARILRHPIY